MSVLLICIEYISYQFLTHREETGSYKECYHSVRFAPDPVSDTKTVCLCKEGEAYSLCMTLSGTEDPSSEHKKIEEAPGKTTPDFLRYNCNIFLQQPCISTIN